MTGDLSENIGQIFLSLISLYLIGARRLTNECRITRAHKKYSMEFNNISSEQLKMWAEDVDYAVTICDADCKILYMNRRSRETFAKHGDIIGNNLMDCHPPRAQELIRKMLATGCSNAYTISKNGLKKLIFQSPWKIDDKIAGLVETSMVLPPDMPHYDRGCS